MEQWECSLGSGCFCVVLGRGFRHTGRGDASGGIRSSSLHEGRRCRRLFRATAIFSVRVQARLGVRGVRHTAGKMRRGIKS